MSHRWLSLAQVADRLGWHPKTVTWLIHTCRLPGLQDKTEQFRIREDHLLLFQAKVREAMWPCGRLRYFDRGGGRLPYDLYAELSLDRDYLVLAETIEADADGVEWRVSTAWLGLDRSLPGSRTPVIFETMIFGRQGVDGDGYQERYATEAAALAGHDRAVAMLRTEILGRSGTEPPP
jgi:hypothetical protein